MLHRATGRKTGDTPANYSIHGVVALTTGRTTQHAPQELDRLCERYGDGSPICGPVSFRDPRARVNPNKASLRTIEGDKFVLPRVLVHQAHRKCLSHLCRHEYVKPGAWTILMVVALRLARSSATPVLAVSQSFSWFVRLRPFVSFLPGRGWGTCERQIPSRPELHLNVLSLI